MYVMLLAYYLQIEAKTKVHGEYDWAGDLYTHSFYQ